MSRYLVSKIIALIAGLVLLVIAYNHNSNIIYNFSGEAYGTTWSISSSEYIADNHKEEIKSIINKIDLIASNYKPESEISQINMNYAEYQFISNDLLKILEIAKVVELSTDGYYNIMLGKISSTLGFAPDFGKNTLQNQASTFNIDETNKSLIRYSNNWFDLSSIAKGYAVQEIHNYLISKNLKNHLIDIGGEIIINGNKNGIPWNIGIQNPLSSVDNATTTISNKNYNFLAIATSGEYRNFKLDEYGNKVTHTINPKTLSSIKNKILSVTVVNDYSATYADAYATAFNAMGLNRAIEVANNENIAIMVIYQNNEAVKINYSDKWYDLFQ